MLPNLSARREMSRAKKPYFSSTGAERVTDSAGASTRGPRSPVCRRPVGIRRAPGTNSERKRSQLRAPGGPEITSYKEAMIASIVATSPGLAAGTADAAGVGVGVAVGVGGCAEMFVLADKIIAI